ncbi:hypothetical protein LR48_Vigan2374s000100 [Vigna angularis]|nr:hypothetical protein LR48_Vigan2374s000100 [Vigna angularis]
MDTIQQRNQHSSRVESNLHGPVAAARTWKACFQAENGSTQQEGKRLLVCSRKELVMKHAYSSNQKQQYMVHVKSSTWNVGTTLQMNLSSSREAHNNEGPLLVLIGTHKVI